MMDKYFLDSGRPFFNIVCSMSHAVRVVFEDILFSKFLFELFLGEFSETKVCLAHVLGLGESNP